MIAEDDGLEYFYKYKDAEGKTRYLLSNNVPLEDWEKLGYLYENYKWAKNISLAVGFLGGLEIYKRLPHWVWNAGLLIWALVFTGCLSTVAGAY